MNTDTQNYHISQINLSFSLLLLFSLNLGKGSENVLNQVNVPIISQERCSHLHWYGNGITEDMVCAGYPNGGKDSCQVNLIPLVYYSYPSCLLLFLTQHLNKPRLNYARYCRH